MLISSFQRSVAKTGKRISAVFFAVLLPFLTPACDYLDARHMETVDAASIVVGVTAASVLKLTAAAFGVVIATAATAKAVDSFQEWLNENGDAQSIATWNQAQAEAQSLALNASFAGSVRDWLKSRFASLDSGEVESVTVGAGQVITNGVEIGAEYADLYAAFLASDFISDWGTNYFYAFGFPGDYPMRIYTSDSTGLYCIFSQAGDFRICQVSDGIISSIKLDYYVARLSGLSISTFQHFPAYVSYASFPFNGDYPIRTNIPVILTDLSSSVSNGALFSTVLSHATATYNLDANEHFATSLGSFSDLNVSKLAALNLDAGKIAKIQSAVDQAVSTNTSEDENGNPVYTEDIAQAVIDAYNQGLEDAGAADPDVPVDPDTPVDPDDPVVTPGDGILGFLQGLKSSLETWITSIPDAIASGVNIIKEALETGWTTLWGHLTGMGDTLTEIAETVMTGFSQVVAGITDIPGTLEGLFTDLQEWIADIPQTLTAGFNAIADSFADLQEWIADIPQTLTAGFGVVADSFAALEGWLADLLDAIPEVGEITLPITDAIENALTVDPDVVQETVEAEKAELWNFPFLAQAKELFDGFQFSAEITYPKIKIETPAIIRPYYDQPEIILLDFEDYKDYCLWARLLFRAAIWLALVWHVVDLATPKLRIS